MAIVIIDYGLGNLNSIENMINRAGGKAEICKSPSDLHKATKIILPGVGAFDHGITGLQNGQWIEALNEVVLHNHTPILGICLGMQLMCNQSEEGKLPGLGWIDSEVRRFEFPLGSALKVPHMGWNTVSIKTPNALIKAEDSEQRFYFVHSYHVVCKNSQNVVATTNHGHEIVAAFNRDNIYGVQFHPEKSHRFGMTLIKNFIEL